MKSDLLQFDGAVQHDSAIDAWFSERGELGKLARVWFEHMRSCGDEVRELIHDGCPVACLGNTPFAYVNVFKAHINVGFFQGASLRDPSKILEGNGKYMRHVKLRPATPTNSTALRTLVTLAYAHMKERVEHG